MQKVTEYGACIWKHTLTSGKLFACMKKTDIIKSLNTLHCKDGSVEYVFLVDVSEEQEAIVGIDPEVPAGEEQSNKNVC